MHFKYGVQRVDPPLKNKKEAVVHRQLLAHPESNFSSVQHRFFQVCSVIPVEHGALLSMAEQFQYQELHCVKLLTKMRMGQVRGGRGGASKREE